VIRTITLLRFISEPELREEITAATNKAESYQDFSAWLRFGREAIERNDPAEQEKIIKFNTLLANCVIFHTALDMTGVLRQLLAEGWPLTPAAIADLSPYIRERIKRFGEYATDGLIEPPAAFNPHLDLTARVDGETALTGQAALTCSDHSVSLSLSVVAGSLFNSTCGLPSCSLVLPSRDWAPSDARLPSCRGDRTTT